MQKAVDLQMFSNIQYKKIYILGKKKKVEEETIDLVEDDNAENVVVPGAAMQDAEKNDQVPEDEFGAKDYR